jgi:hypothetical protein
MTSVRAVRGKMTSNNPNAYPGVFGDETVKNSLSMISHPYVGTVYNQEIEKMKEWWSARIAYLNTEINKY